MKMYVWRENFLVDYTSGLAVAVANSIAEARQLLLDEATDWEKPYVDADIASEPEIFDLPVAVFISGGG